jgi:signal transduction histidine kinase
LNLLSNAIKYSNAAIDLNTVVGNNKLILSISDKGIGIPEEEQQNLFVRFFRAKNAENIQGTGLGLSIVQRYLELLNGTIEFSSKLDQGSTFIVKLPQND